MYTKTVESKGKRNCEFIGIYALNEYLNNWAQTKGDCETMKAEIKAHLVETQIGLLYTLPFLRFQWDEG